MLSCLAVLSAALAALAQALPAPAAAGPAVTINLSTTYQEFDGMGISEAFQRGRIIKGADGLTNAQTDQVLDLLFSNTTGAGFTILRNGIGSSPSEPYDHMESIAPVGPALATDPLKFVSLESLRGDQQQIWLSKQFKARGGRLIYADAWSADGYMKTNGLDTNGGYICGVTNTSCATGDWRQAYADKIVKFIQDYENHGIQTDYVGFLNEPDLSTPYASMQSDGQQAADFISVLHPTLQKANLTTQIACCDGSGWEQNRARLTGIQEAGAEDQLGLVTSHGYSSAPGVPFNTTRKVWETEWSTFDSFNEAWYATGSQSEGLTWANHIQSAFGTSNVSAFLYWWGAANDTDNEPLIRIPGRQVLVSSRLWAHAHWGRLVQPGAYRVDASVVNTDSSMLNVTSFANPDGSVALQLINNGLVDQSVTLNGASEAASSSVTGWLTNVNNSFTETALGGSTSGYFVTTVPAMSLMSLLFR